MARKKIILQAKMLCVVFLHQEMMQLLNINAESVNSITHIIKKLFPRYSLDQLGHDAKLFRLTNGNFFPIK